MHGVLSESKKERGIMRKKVKSILAVALLCAMSVSNVHAQTAFAGEVRKPDTFIVNGDIVYENKEDRGIQVEDGVGGIQSRVLMGYDYVPGYERLANMTIVHELAYIYGTSIKYSKGANPEYTLSTTKKTTKSTSWNVSGSLSGAFDIKAVKANLAASGGYSTSKTAEVTKGETWKCSFTEAGTYNLTWYMRGHQYSCQCGAKYISNDSNDGRFTYYNLGTVTFPTDEITFEITKVK